LGFDIEGPFISQAKRGAHPSTLVRERVDVPLAELEPLVDGLRVMTVAPEIPGGLELIAWLAARGVAVSLGHSAATVDEARAGYAAGGRTTTHLFNGMSGVDHRSPGLAVAALTDDAAYVELIADGHHVHPALWDLIRRAKPVDRLLLVSDALSLSGTGPGRTWVGATDVEVLQDRAIVAGTTTLAGSVLALDSMLRNLVRNGAPLPAASRAASHNPAQLLGAHDRGRLGVGLRADLVEMDDDLRVGRVMRAGAWVA
jgi:N-acetylglucosamine-6-phosphate deacetylase